MAEEKMTLENCDLEDEELLLFWLVLSKFRGNPYLFSEISNQFEMETGRKMTTRKIGKFLRTFKSFSRNFFKRTKGHSIDLFSNNFLYLAVCYGFFEYEPTDKYISCGAIRPYHVKPDYKDLAFDLIIARQKTSALNL